MAEEVYTVFQLARTLERAVFGKHPKEDTEQKAATNRFRSLRDQLVRARFILKDVLHALEVGAGLTEEPTLPKEVS